MCAKSETVSQLWDESSAKSATNGCTDLIWVQGFFIIVKQEKAEKGQQLW